MHSKVSVIIPVYKTEKFLKKCLESVLNQTYSNLEVIVINDGSPDNSAKVIQAFTDPRLIYLEKENTGVGNTRNIGIAKSTGDYLMFVDSDDYLELNTIELLVNKATQDKCDLIVFDMFIETTRQIELHTKQFTDTSLKDNPALITEINLGPCNKLYHKSLFKDKTNRFIENLKFEDAPVVVHSLRDAKKIGLVSTCLYHYVIQKTGETITRDARVLDILKICQIIDTKIKDYSYINRTNLMVKILMPYLKNSRFIKDRKLRNKLIKEIFAYLKTIDKNWRNCSYLKTESFRKRILLTNELLLSTASLIYAKLK